MEIFDEDKAVEFILAKLSENPAITTKYKEDDILEVIDVIWDYYESNGFLDIDMSLDESDEDKDTETDKQKLITHVIKMISKDKYTKLRSEDIPYIVEYELDYESLCD